MTRTIAPAKIALDELNALLSYLQEVIDAIEETLDDDLEDLDVQYWTGAATSLYHVEKRIRGRIATLKHQE